MDFVIFLYWSEELTFRSSSEASGVKSFLPSSSNCEGPTAFFYAIKNLLQSSMSPSLTFEKLVGPQDVMLQWLRKQIVVIRTVIRQTEKTWSALLPDGSAWNVKPGIQTDWHGLIGLKWHHLWFQTVLKESVTGKYWYTINPKLSLRKASSFWVQYAFLQFFLLSAKTPDTKTYVIKRLTKIV